MSPTISKKQTTESTGTTKKEKSSETTGTTNKKASEAAGATKQDEKSSTAGTSEETVGSKDKMKKQEATGESETTGATGKTGKLDIPSDKRAEVRKSFTVKNVKRVNLDIDVSVGVHVPRDIVFYAVPTTIVRIVPEFRGFKYFVLADGTIVIVDPDTYEFL
jgi:Protein of unknown function (DUF1236)